MYDDDASDDAQIFMEAMEENLARALPIVLNQLMLKVWLYRNYSLVNWNFFKIFPI